MSETSTTKEVSIDDSHESFIDVESELEERTFNGYLTLKSAEIRHRENLDIDGLTFEEYIVFKTETDEDIIIVPADNNNPRHKFILEWSGVDRIGSLYNKKIPVDKIDDNIYKPSNTIRHIDVSNKDDINTLINDNYLRYSNQSGKWVKGDNYELLMSLGAWVAGFLSLLASMGIIYIINMGLVISYIIIPVLSIVITYCLVYAENNIDLFGDPIYKIVDFIIR